MESVAVLPGVSGILNESKRMEMSCELPVEMSTDHPTIETSVSQSAGVFVEIPDKPTAFELSNVESMENTLTDDVSISNMLDNIFADEAINNILASFDENSFDQENLDEISSAILDNLL